MKKQTKQSISIALILFIVTIIIVINYYNKPHINVETESADYTLSVQELVEAYTIDETHADNLYSNKIIEVTGFIDTSYIEYDDLVVILKNKKQENVIVTCRADQQHRINDLKNGQLISVKGICAGYITDVIMTDCIITITSNKFKK